MPRAFRLCAALLVASVSPTALAQLGGTRAQEEESATLRQPNALYDASPHQRKSQLIIHGVYQWGSGLGAGARYALPLLHDGALPELNDSIALEGGADFVANVFVVGAPYLRLSGEGRWMFHFIPSFEGYLKLGAFFVLQFGGTPLSTPFGIQVALGVAYRLGNISVRAETGVEGVKIGVALDI